MRSQPVHAAAAAVQCKNLPSPIPQTTLYYHSDGQGCVSEEGELQDWKGQGECVNGAS